MRVLATTLLCHLLLAFPQAGPGHACTSFSFDTPGGPIFAANCDLFIPGDGLVLVNRRGIAKLNIRQSMSGDTASWTSRFGSVTFNLAGRGFAWSGMNEAGLVVSILELRATKYPKPDERAPFDSGSWIQYVLDTCGSVQEAIQVNSRVRLFDDADSPSHFLIADASGDCAGFEWLDGKFVCYTGEDLPVRAMSNIRYARALQAYERGGRRWWWSNPGRSFERFADAAARSESYDAKRDTCAASYALETLAQVVAEPNTKWNIAYDIAKREVWFRSVASPTVKRLSLSAFDLSCEAPMLMLDVNAALEGNVEGSFAPYEHDANLAVFSTFCDRWGIKVSADDAVELMRFFEGFECAAEAGVKREP